MTKQNKVVRAEAFISKVNIPRTESNLRCWEWVGARSNFGYGSFKLDNKTTTAHRASWVLFYGDIPEGMWVLHKCDNPPCVNPSHLELGDRKKNMLDCVKRGRHNNAKKTHCSNGHPFSRENTILRTRTKRGFVERVCYECHKITANENGKKRYALLHPLKRKKGER